MKTISDLRSNRWRDVPTTPGVYWWYFPGDAVDRLQMRNYCQLDRLLLRSHGNSFCLYHGMASILRERISGREGHATQRLTLACLNNRTLSSFRLTLLALTRVEYSDAGAEKLNQFMDACSIVWTPASSPDEAHAMETSELKNSDYHYPLNDAHHKRPVLKTCRASLRAPRAAYRRQYLS